MTHLADIEARAAALSSRLLARGDTTAAEFLTSDIPALIAELRWLRQKVEGVGFDLITAAAPPLHPKASHT